MTPRLGRYVARFGLVMMVLFTAVSTVTQVTYEDGPPENGWGDNMVSVLAIPVCFVTIAIEEWETDFTVMGILLLYAGGFLGLTVMAVGLAMAGAGARVNEGVPRIGLGVAVVGVFIAVSCSVPAVLLDDTGEIRGLQFMWTPDATMKCQALWLLGGIVGFNLVVVGLVTAAVVALTRQPGQPVSWPGPIMPRQGRYVALVGLGIIVLCVEAGLLIPDVGLGIVWLYLGGFVGLVVVGVGLVLAAARVFMIEGFPNG